MQEQPRTAVDRLQLLTFWSVNHISPGKPYRTIANHHNRPFSLVVFCLIAVENPAVT